MTRFHVLFDVAVIVLITGLFHININQRHNLEMSARRNSINEDQIRELMSIAIQGSHQNHLELAQGQGKVEGILSAIKNEDITEQYGSVWHDGYYQGLDQHEYTKNIPEVIQVKTVE
jgi:hypothetical protein